MQTDIVEVESMIRSLELVQLGEPSLQDRLAIFINGLILNNFEGLISLLYRLDVNENKLRQLLSENINAESGKLIAGLIIERQLQKIKSRLENRQDNNIDDSEKW